MNTTYTLTEGNDALNRVLLMMQYELGKTLDEQKIPTDKDIKKFKDNERYNNTQKFVDNTAVSFRGPDGRQKTTGTSPKVSQIQKPAFHMTLDEFMEGYRDALTHPVMIGLEVALTSTGVGVGAVVAAYTALLAYDVYKGVVNKDWDWLNIVFDVLGIVSSGVISGTLRPIMKGAQGLKLNTIGKVLTYLSKTKIWSEIKPLLKGGITLLKSISKGIWKALEWISRKTGFRQLKVAGKSVEVMIQNIIFSIEEFLKSSVKKTVKFLEPGVNVGIKEALKRGIITAGFAAALPLGISVVYDKLIKPKLKGGTFEYTQLNPEDNNFLREFYVKNNKEYFPNGINKIEFVSNKEKDFTTKLRIDGKMYQIVDELKYKLKKI
jgi:uncharacterized protein YnzC (UPF0291/DUF896 family)